MFPERGKGRRRKAFITAREQQAHEDIAGAKMLVKFKEKWQFEKCVASEKKCGTGLEGEK